MRTARNSSSAKVILLLGVVGLLLSVAGCTGQAMTSPGGSGSGGGGSSPQPSALVTFCDTPNAGCPAATSFSLSSLRDLNIFVAWSNVPKGTHTQTLRVLLPSGDLYQAYDMSFAIAPQGAGSASLLRGMPVAGSFITERKLTGDWRVEVWLDGTRMSSQAVQLSP